MKKLLVICGPTATGKTKLALYLAKKFNGELVAADSRQVYKGMDIGTGKDIPEKFRFKISDLRFPKSPVGYFTDGETRIWGYDLVDPTKEFSVWQYINIAGGIIGDIRERGKLPILVGGTGLYIKGVVDGIETSGIPKNQKLRKSLDGKFADELLGLLAGLDPVKAASLNISDKKNPRRLIRAIEVSRTKDKRQRTKDKAENVLFVGLNVSKDKLNIRIEARVTQRVNVGFEEELKSLLENGMMWKMQSMSSLGYQQYKDFAFGRISKNTAIMNWKKAETKYAKRQITWFKRDKRINWFDPTKKDWQENVEKLVNKWYKVG